MSRPREDGLKYFSFDTDFFYADKRIKRLRTRYGNDGLIFYIYLLTEIYRNGYYVRWDEEYIEDIMDELRLTEGFIEQVMTFLVSRSLLTKSTLADSDTIITTQKEGDGRPQCELADGGNGQKRVTVITSPGIQKRYQEAAKRLKRDVKVDADIWLLNESDTAACIKVTHKDSKSGKNPDKSGKNTDKSEKNATKENKVNKSKLKEKKIKENSTMAASPQYYPDEFLNQAFVDFMEMRKKIRKPMTEKAVILAMNKLKELSSPYGSMDNDTAIKILEQSTMNCWQGLFPLKEVRQRTDEESGWAQKWRDA